MIFKQEKPRYSVVFPTAETIRKSVGGYGSGASIHMKTQTPAQAKQLSDLRPMLCHWAGATGKLGVVRAAGYAPAYLLDDPLSYLFGLEAMMPRFGRFVVNISSFFSPSLSFFELCLHHWKSIWPPSHSPLSPTLFEMRQQKLKLTSYALPDANALLRISRLIFASRTLQCNK